MPSTRHSGKHLDTPNTYKACSSRVFLAEWGGAARPKIAYTDGVKVPKKKVKKKRPLKGKGKDPRFQIKTTAVPAPKKGGTTEPDSLSNPFDLAKEPE